MTIENNTMTEYIAELHEELRRLKELALELTETLRKRGRHALLCNVHTSQGCACKLDNIIKWAEKELGL